MYGKINYFSYFIKIYYKIEESKNVFLINNSID